MNWHGVWSWENDYPIPKPLLMFQTQEQVCVNQ